MTTIVSVKLPSRVVTVMVAVPAPIPSINPSPMMRTIDESLDVHVVYTSGAEAGVTINSSCIVDPKGSANVAKLISTPVTLPCCHNKTPDGAN